MPALQAWAGGLPAPVAGALYAAGIPQDAVAERSIRLYLAINKMVADEGWDFFFRLSLQEKKGYIQNGEPMLNFLESREHELILSHCSIQEFRHDAKNNCSKRKFAG